MAEPVQPAAPVPSPVFAVVGEVLVDLVWPSGSTQLTAHPGGSPANVAIGLHRLGRPVELVTSWGDDPAGALVGGHLAGTGVPVRRVAAEAAGTMLAVAHLDAESGGAGYDFLARWSPLDVAPSAGVALLHTGSLAIAVEPGAGRVVTACREFRAAGGTVSVDLNVRPAVLPDPAAYRAAVARVVAQADVVKASTEDLEWLYPDGSPAEAARGLLGSGPRLAVVTDGPHGAAAFTAGAEVRVPAPPTEVVDTIGAGDSFQAALLDGLVGADGKAAVPADGEALRALLERCARAGSLACARPGAQPPTRAELDG